MPDHETINSLISLLAVAIAAISLVRARKVEAQQLEYSAINAAYTRKLLERIEKEDQAEQNARVSAELLKVSTGNYRFVITNEGAATATDVVFSIESAGSDDPLSENECKRKLPYPKLNPGESFSLIAGLHMGSTMNYASRVTWKDPDGTVRSVDRQLTL